MATESFTNTVTITEEGYECILRVLRNADADPFVYERPEVVYGDIKELKKQHPELK